MSDIMIEFYLMKRNLISLKYFQTFTITCVQKGT